MEKILKVAGGKTNKNHHYVQGEYIRLTADLTKEPWKSNNKIL